MTDPPPPSLAGAPLTWLRGDLHTHCEDFALGDAFLDSIDPRLDFLALTNHAQKAVFFRQHEMVEALRRRWDRGPLFFGMEWNTPRGGHACVVFPPAPAESERAYELSRGFDRKAEGSRRDVAGALATLAGGPDCRPLAFFNHPSPGHWLPETVAEFRRCDPGGVVVGIEAVNGHQGYDAGTRWDLGSYPGCAPGGLADTVSLEGRPFALLANSDFHIHKRSQRFDYAPGVFNHTLVGVAGTDRCAAAVLEGLRAGRTCAAQGHWLELGDFRVEGEGAPAARIGAAWRGGPAVAVAQLASAEPLHSLDLIGGLDAGEPSVVARFGPRPAGAHRVEWPVPAGATGFLRLRALSASSERPPPGPPAPKGFFTSAILLGSP